MSNDRESWLITLPRREVDGDAGLMPVRIISAKKSGNEWYGAKRPTSARRQLMYWSLVHIITKYRMKEVSWKT
jgi:hypothetical protein